MAIALNAVVAISFLSGAMAQVTPGASMMSSSTLKLARSYEGDNFFSGFEFESVDDPTGGYVNYVTESVAKSEGLASVVDGAVIMRANSEDRAQGRGRDSVRISSKDEWADGVYILDVNHMPVGCGSWPAWWTVVKDGWPNGGEIDIIEGANALPTPNGRAWNATSPITPTDTYKFDENAASLHIEGTCMLTPQYQLGDVGQVTCDARINGNSGCGVYMGGNDTYGVGSFGQEVNNNGGGWYALWRDYKKSGGAYVYYWPRNSPNVPDNVKNAGTGDMDTSTWGQPGANLSIPNCRGDFDNHVIVFNIAFCGDYATPTYTPRGCPSNCISFVMNNPEAFAETYWSINSLRIYNESGKPASSGGLSAGAIAGIVIGVIIALALAGILFWRYRKNRRGPRSGGGERSLSITGNERYALEGEEPGSTEGDGTTTPKPYSFLGSNNVPTLPSAAGARSGTGAREPTGAKTFGINLIPKNPKVNIVANGYNREGRTKLAPGKSARNYLAGETPLAPKVEDQDGFKRRGSATSGPKAFIDGGEWVNVASGGRRGSQAPSTTGSGRGWAG